MSRQAIDAAVPPLLARLGLEEAATRAVGTFSKGMTQRLGLAQAMLHDPELLILDEPTSGLDPEGRRLVLDIIGEEKAKGRTVFLSSHILSDVERTCDEVVMVNHGEVAFSHQIAAFQPGGDDCTARNGQGEVLDRMDRCASHSCAVDLRQALNVDDSLRHCVSWARSVSDFRRTSRGR